MTFKEQVDDAISVHAVWKGRLKNAISQGRSEFDPAVVMTDNQCDFGKWLYEKIPTELRESPLYKSILRQHADFHKESARILTLAVSGKAEEALASMQVGSKFVELSTALTATMLTWRDSF